jgi:hypothetical protein
LADDLVAGGKTDEMGETLDRDRVAVANEIRDRVTHRGYLARCHPRIIAHATLVAPNVLDTHATMAVPANVAPFVAPEV